MVLKINGEILDFVETTDYSDDIREFLKRALLLEFKRHKEDIKHYTKDYDIIIQKYVDKRRKEL